MSDSKTLDVIKSVTEPTYHNVKGWERAGSLFVGVITVGKGLRRGGILGLAQIAIGGVALARGWTGHSAAKTLIENSRRDLDDIRSKIERAGEELVNLKNNAESAVKGTTVTGDEPVVPPKA
jgi:uncharacterized membrane protein